MARKVGYCKNCDEALETKHYDHNKAAYVCPECGTWNTTADLAGGADDDEGVDDDTGTATEV